MVDGDNLCPPPPASPIKDERRGYNPIGWPPKHERLVVTAAAAAAAADPRRPGGRAVRVP